MTWSSCPYSSPIGRTWGPLNEICLRWFSEPYPARTPVKTELPGALFMADAVVLYSAEAGETGARLVGGLKAGPLQALVGKCSAIQSGTGIAWRVFMSMIKQVASPSNGFGKDLL
ncbi:MAG: hypothetical protein CM1200mP20_07610 [Pseudomonadota bacterium]|nr:MAG: hypothetical protein CM1200mP20_07610 [Pseudomonadota bacterium]